MRKTSSECCPVAIFFLPILASPALSQDSSTIPSSAAEGPGTANSTVKTSTFFFTHFSEAYQEDWHPTQPAGADPVRRGYPAPLDSPPFPSGDYSVGGTPVIGTPDTQSYMLMQAINPNRIIPNQEDEYGYDPEMRLEHSYDLAAYELGTKKTQFIAAADLTYHF
jgi:hypothetical protein